MLEQTSGESLIPTMYKKKPAKCGCDGCVYEDDPDCPIQREPDSSKWECVIENCIFVKEDN